MNLPRLRGLSISLTLHVAVVAPALILISEPAPPSALFIDLTRPLDGPATEGAGASPPAPAVSAPPSAGPAPRRGPAPRDRARPSVASAPSPVPESSTAPPTPRRPEPPLAASPQTPIEERHGSAGALPSAGGLGGPLGGPPSKSNALPSAGGLGGPLGAPPSQSNALPSAGDLGGPLGGPPSQSNALPSAGGLGGPSRPSISIERAAAGAIDAATGGSGTVSTQADPGLATSVPTPPSPGTGTDGNTTGGNERGPGTTALAVPGEGARAGGEYAAYLALVRRHIQEALRYPVAARRRGLTGSVHVEITVEPTGRIATVSLVASSSHPLLDEAALEAVRALPRVPFPPDVAPRSLRVRLPVVFELR